MIRIHKSGTVPSKLAGKGVTETLEFCKQYDAYPHAYQQKYNKDTNPHKFEFDSDIYGHKTVKDQLKEDQHDKCCYCESKFTNTGYGDVEHYRPKAAYQQKTTDSLQYPGYYWLAYNWDNLIFSCQICNQRYKKNRFPLQDDAKRAHSHHDTISNEDSLLIHPAFEEPSVHIGFRDGVIYHKNHKGLKSIQAYGLKRLNEEREKFLELHKPSFVLARIDLNDQNDIDMACQLFGMSESDLQREVLIAKDIVDNCENEDAEFSATMRDYKASI